MFERGDKVVYCTTGVCVIDDVKLMDCAGNGEQRQYYVMRPIGQDYVISAPVDGEAFIRPVISKAEADRLIDTIPGLHADVYHSAVMRELTEHYQAAIETHDCADLIGLTMSIYSKKVLFEQQKGKFGAIDTRFMKRAEELLFGEFSAALGIPRDTVRGYIEERVAASKKAGA